MRVYHWTHVSLLNSIRRTGLDPAKATGARKLVWLCESGLIETRRTEVAKRHGWDVRDMVLLSVRIDGLPIWPYHTSGMRVSRSVIAPHRVNVTATSNYLKSVPLCELEV